MTETTKPKQGKPWTNKAIFRTYEEAFTLVQEINMMSASSEKKVATKIKRRGDNTFVVKVRLIEDERKKTGNG